MESKPHFVLVPLLAQGHMIPMLDMAHLLAEGGARVSYITTAVNAGRIKTTIDRIKESGLPIHFVEFQLPCAKAGLPEGCENFDLLPSIDFFKSMMSAIGMLREPLELYLRAQHSPPACIITDFCNPPETTDAARELRIPRVIFHTTSCFFPLCAHLIYRHKIFDRIIDEYETFLVPDFPGEAIEVNKVQAPGFFGGLASEDLLESALKAEATAEGLVINSFDELEPSYIQQYEKMLGKKVWAIGPLCLYNKDVDNKATRGNNSSIDNRKILTWLDSKEEMSVIYISFGSYALVGPSQLIEIGSGLEASNKPFIWVVKGVERSIPEVEKWLCEFEERTSSRGIIIRGWAPQMVILSHPAVGGFFTHCGWNSTLEAVAGAGVPMVTWPRVADQFLNEKLVVQVLRIGVSAGVKVPSSYLAEDTDVVVKRDDIEKAVWNLMDGGEEGEERRKRAKDLGEKARRAMDEEGSSYMNMKHLLQYFS
ncbi:UDP-glycosyltransferase 73C6-like [Typha angustifolia]|uniref:UDP-glycosyltransferase 73C6-like n=1 Tax=Typha angustifolia TaxID=59011 RepID=UPI003C2F6C9F